MASTSDSSLRIAPRASMLVLLFRSTHRRSVTLVTVQTVDASLRNRFFVYVSACLGQVLPLESLELKPETGGMRAMVLEQPTAVDRAPLVMRDLPVSTPGPEQLLVAVRCCGLCHTDLHTVEGELTLPKLPVVPGHQIVGLVAGRGAKTGRFREGDRVGIPWLHRTDGTCEYCRAGNENLCDHAEFTGLHANGGYAEFAVVDEDFAYGLPAAFDDAHAAPLLCAGVIGYRSFRLSGARPGDRVGLYGFGASAHVVLQFARHLGCEVFVFTRAESHRQLALRLGAAWVGDVKDEIGVKLDAAIIFAPAGALVVDALRALRKGGTVALAGVTMSAIPQLEYGLLYHERVLRSVANSTRQDVREFLELAAEAKVRTEVTEFALEDANLALQRLKASQIEGAGVLRIAR
jgi:propanol-preferring alcohol dehydrogenase